MLLSASVVLVLAVLLINEWRFESRALRCVAGSLCATGYLLLAPSSDSVARRVIYLPVTERELLAPTGSSLSEYGSGVVTMHREFDAVAKFYHPVRSALFISLVWLAMSPALRASAGGSNAKRDAATTKV